MTLYELIKDKTLPVKVKSKVWPETDYVEIIAMSDRAVIGFNMDGDAWTCGFDEVLNTLPTWELYLKPKMKPNPFLPKEQDSNFRKAEIYIDGIRTWLDSECPTYFDETFFESVESQFLERGFISEKQLQALENIYESIDR